MGHTYSRLLIHVIFSTKNREPTMAAAIRPRLYEYMAGIARSEFGQALKIGGTADHLHGLLHIRTDIAVAEAVGKFKSLSSGWLHKTFPDAAPFAWQAGYAAFTVSQSSTDDVIAYIANQEEHHRRHSFQEELIAFLQRHGVAYDPATMWD